MSLKNSHYRVALHDHFGQDIMSTQEGIHMILNTFGLNTIQAVGGRAYSHKPVSDRLRALSKVPKKIQNLRDAYKRLFGRKNGNSIEHNFLSFSDRIFSCVSGARELVPDVMISCPTPHGETVFVKLQEVDTLEAELLVYGIPEDYPNGLSAHEVIDDVRAHGGMVILSTPFIAPSSSLIGTVFRTAKRIVFGYPHVDIAKKVDAIEAYNQQISRVPFSNYRAHSLARKLDKPRTIASDKHFYRDVGEKSIEQSFMWIPKDLLNFSRPNALIAQIKHAITILFTHESHFRSLSHMTKTWRDMLQVLRLTRRQQRELYTIADPIDE